MMIKKIFGKKLYVSVHAGHNPKGRIACGASDYLDESSEARKICRTLCKKLKKKGVIVYNDTVNNGKSQIDVLHKILGKINKHKRVDVVVSIHFNADSHSTRDGKVKGSEVWLYDSDNSQAVNASKNFLEKMEDFGFTNRGVKYSKNLYILRKTEQPAMLFEVCFVDDKDDSMLYKKVSYDKIAGAIANSIIKNF